MRPTDTIPRYVLDTSFFSITKSEEELSIVCTQDACGKVAFEREDGWRVLSVEGPLDFSLIGVLGEISRILAEQEISIFVISTFDTDHIMVKKERLDRAVSALQEQGHIVNRST